MPTRSPIPSSSEASLAKGLVIGWGLFMAIVAVGIVLSLRLGASAPILLDVLPL